MRQTLHIFKKDVRHLRGEIIMVWTFTAIFAWRPGEDWTQVMLVLGAAFLIARVVHAEPIPGDRQFWITRPYRWKDLLASKVLFILAFVSLPTLLAQIYILSEAKFPVAPNWAALLWSQFLNLFLWLAIAAVAAITSGNISFNTTAFILAAAVAVFLRLTFVVGVDMRWPVGFGWIRNSLAMAIIGAIAATILYMQYKKRLTRLSQIGAVGALALLAAAYVYLPPSWAMNLQSRPSIQRIGDSSIQFALAPHVPNHLANRLLDHEIPADLPFAVNGVPVGEEVQIEAATILLQSSDGKAFHVTVTGANQRSAPTGPASFDIPFAMPASFFNAERAEPVTLHASLYFTVFGNARTKTIPLRSQPVDLMDGIRCGRGPFNRFVCESPFRWPARLVYVQAGGPASSLGYLLSYSPFPSGVNLDDSIAGRWTDLSPFASRATITVEQPLAHLRRDLVIDNVYLTDITPNRF
jgi:hypothetical protein